MPIYRINPEGGAIQVKTSEFSTERQLQKLFENNLESLLGVRFISSEFHTGEQHRGRIDTIGLDQDNNPTIVEYKKSSSEDILSQGLFYLSWLIDHKGDFIVEAHKELGTDIDIDWNHPRLIFIAKDYSKYVKTGIDQVGANIELWIYRRYGDDLIYLEPLHVPIPREPITPDESSTGDTDQIIEIPTYTIDYHFQRRSDQVIELFDQLREKILGLSDEGEITEKANKMYIGYSHGKNFCEVRIQASGLKLWLDIPYDDLNDPYNLTRDVSNIGHHGTGQVDLKLKNPENVEKIIYLIQQSYLLTT